MQKTEESPFPAVQGCLVLIQGWISGYVGSLEETERSDAASPRAGPISYSCITDPFPLGGLAKGAHQGGGHGDGPCPYTLSEIHPPAGG